VHSLTRKELYKRLKKSDLETKLYNSCGVVFSYKLLPGVRQVELKNILEVYQTVGWNLAGTTLVAAERSDPLASPADEQ
jgi:hypothetical protein